VVGWLERGQLPTALTVPHAVCTLIFLHTDCVSAACAPLVRRVPTRWQRTTKTACGRYDLFDGVSLPGQVQVPRQSPRWRHGSVAGAVHGSLARPFCKRSVAPGVAATATATAMVQCQLPAVHGEQHTTARQLLVLPAATCRPISLSRRRAMTTRVNESRARAPASLAQWS
jgi:hypothetical protein